MVEESGGDISFEKKSIVVDTVNDKDPSDKKVEDHGKEVEKNKAKTETQEQKEVEDVLISAGNLINTFSKKLGAAYELDKRVAHGLLKDIKQAGSGMEALQKLDQLVVLLEDMLAELNKATLLSRYNMTHEVSVADASSHTITIFDGTSEPMEDEELHSAEQQSTEVKKKLLEFTSHKYPEIMSPFPEN